MWWKKNESMNNFDLVSALMKPYKKIPAYLKNNKNNAKKQSPL